MVSHGQIQSAIIKHVVFKCRAEREPGSVADGFPGRQHRFARGNLPLVKFKASSILVRGLRSWLAVGLRSESLVGHGRWLYQTGPSGQHWLTVRKILVSYGQKGLTTIFKRG